MRRETQRCYLLEQFDSKLLGPVLASNEFGIVVEGEVYANLLDTGLTKLIGSWYREK